MIYRPGDRRRRPRYRNSLRTAIRLDDDSLASMTYLDDDDDEAEHDPPEIAPLPLMRSSQVARDFPVLRSLPDGVLPANINRPPSVVPPSQADTDEYMSSSSEDGHSSDDTWVPDSNDEMEQTD